MSHKRSQVILNLEPSGFSRKAADDWAEAGEYIEAEHGTALERQAASAATILIIRLKRMVTVDFLDQYPNLKVVVSATTGLDHIDLEALEVRNIRLVSLRGETDFLASIPSTAEHAFGLMLALLRNTTLAHNAVLAGSWDRDAFRGRQLYQRNIGLVGFGRTAKMLAEYAKVFGANVGYCDPYIEEANQFSRFDTLEKLIEHSEIISIHVHLNDETRNLIGRNLDRADNKPRYLVNTSRGAIVDEDAVVELVRAGAVAGVAADVLRGELIDLSKNPLIMAAKEGYNIIVTPHVGGGTIDAMNACEEFIARKCLGEL